MIGPIYEIKGSQLIVMANYTDRFNLTFISYVCTFKILTRIDISIIALY